MKTVIYLDILLLVNFLTGYFLLLGTDWLAGAGSADRHLLLGALASALSTLIVLAPTLPGLVSLLYKVISGGLIIWITFGWRGWRPFFRSLGWFVLLNIGLAGLVLLAVTRGGFSNMQVHNLSVYINLSPPLLVGSVVCMYGLVRLMLFLFGHPSTDQLWKLELCFKPEQTVSLSAFYDTGFFLKDPFGGGQVVMVSWTSAQSRLPDSINRFLRDYFNGENPLPPEGLRFRLIPCRSAGSSAALPGFVISKAQLIGPNRCCEAQNPTVVFCPEPLRDGRFDALFGSEFLHCETKPGRNGSCNSITG